MNAIFWFRRDLRLEDNTGLYHALSSGKKVFPVFIFDTHILDKLEDKSDSRVSFIYRQVLDIKKNLEKRGSTLYVYHGKPLEIFKSILNHHQVSDVFTNHDYEPYARERDEEVKDFLEIKNIGFHSFKDQVIFEKDDVLKDDGKPYTVFTPYMRKWKNKFNLEFIKPYPSEELLSNFIAANPSNILSISELGFVNSDIGFPSKKPDRSIISNYHETRDIPSIQGTSRLSVHLRFGTISIRRLINLALELNEKWLNELIWREFYMSILWHFPHVASRSFKPAYDNIPWNNNEEHFKAWCVGETGYPIVDAGMRELNQTGYMHNRVRMIAASFLVKHLLIDWRWGEAYFARKLLDFELSSNNGGWQWAASSGVDAAPYFRVFNPYLQAKKFDPDNLYIKKWVPEYGDPKKYTHPIVEHSEARKRALETYKSALQ